jgi:hypothetical protein
VAVDQCAGTCAVFSASWLGVDRFEKIQIFKKIRTAIRFFLKKLRKLFLKTVPEILNCNRRIKKEVFLHVKGIIYNFIYKFTLFKIN